MNQNVISLHVPWLCKPFIECEEIFAFWPAAREELKMCIAQMQWWECEYYDGNDIFIGLQFPQARDYSGEMDYVFYSYPFQAQTVIKKIYATVYDDYLPFDQVQSVTTKGERTGLKFVQVKPLILKEIKQREEYLASYGARGAIDELAFRFGVLSFQ